MGFEPRAVGQIDGARRDVIDGGPLIVALRRRRKPEKRDARGAAFGRLTGDAPFRGRRRTVGADCCPSRTASRKSCDCRAAPRGARSRRSLAVRCAPARAEFRAPRDRGDEAAATERCRQFRERRALAAAERSLAAEPRPREPEGKHPAAGAGSKGEVEPLPESRIARLLRASTPQEDLNRRRYRQRVGHNAPARRSRQSGGQSGDHGIRGSSRISMGVQRPCAKRASQRKRGGAWQELERNLTITPTPVERNVVECYFDPRHSHAYACSSHLESNYRERL